MSLMGQFFFLSQSNAGPQQQATASPSTSNGFGQNAQNNNGRGTNGQDYRGRNDPMQDHAPWTSSTTSRTTMGPAPPTGMFNQYPQQTPTQVCKLLLNPDISTHSTNTALGPIELDLKNITYRK